VIQSAHMQRHDLLPAGWIRFWIGLGVAVFVLYVCGLMALASYAMREANRRDGCDKGLRHDCEKSLLWVLADASRQAREETSTQVGGPVVLEEGPVTYARTSESSPRVISIQPGSMTLNDNWYVAVGGSKVKLTAVVEGNVQSVEVYLIPKATETIGIGTHVGTMNRQADGTYTFDITIDRGLLADLEIRAVGGPNEYGSAVIQVRAE
jgi:hypothetical protein